MMMPASGPVGSRDSATAGAGALTTPGATKGRHCGDTMLRRHDCDHDDAFGRGRRGGDDDAAGT